MNDPHDNAQTDKEALARYGESLTHAKTEHQPYAWAIAAGHCPIINSTVRPPLEMVGKLIGIHAGKTDDLHDYADCVRRLGTLASQMPPTRTLGALIGVARLVGVVRNLTPKEQDRYHAQYDVIQGRCSSVAWAVTPETEARIEPWWRGPWGWLLEEAVLLPEPISMRGQQGLWRIPSCISWAGGNCVDDKPHHCTPAVWALEQWRKAREVVR